MQYSSWLRVLCVTVINYYWRSDCAWSVSTQHRATTLVTWFALATERVLSSPSITLCIAWLLYLFVISLSCVLIALSPPPGHIFSSLWRFVSFLDFLITLSSYNSFFLWLLLQNYFECVLLVVSNIVALKKIADLWSWGNISYRDDKVILYVLKWQWWLDFSSLVSYWERCAQVRYQISRGSSWGWSRT